MGGKLEEDELLIRLADELELTPYESRAYLAVLLHGPMSPNGVNQKSGIPRPRTYDVLNGLVGKGLLMEQPGRPTMYAAIDPKLGLKRTIARFEGKMARQLEEKRKALEGMAYDLSALYNKTREGPEDEEKVWVTRRDSAFIDMYCDTIRKIEREFVVITPAPTPPEKEILTAVRDALIKKKTVRVIRNIKPPWPLEDIDRYLELAQLGEQQKYLDYEGLRFAIFDAKETVLILPPERGSQLAVWTKLPQFTEIMYDRFEALWSKAKPAEPVLKRLRESLS